jgi:hypothetical protein
LFRTDLLDYFILPGSQMVSTVINYPFMDNALELGLAIRSRYNIDTSDHQESRVEVPLKWNISSNAFLKVKYVNGVLVAVPNITQQKYEAEIGIQF